MDELAHQFGMLLFVPTLDVGHALQQSPLLALLFASPLLLIAVHHFQVVLVEFQLLAKSGRQRPFLEKGPLGEFLVDGCCVVRLLQIPFQLQDLLFEPRFIVLKGARTRSLLTVELAESREFCFELAVPLDNFFLLSEGSLLVVFEQPL